MPSLCKEAAIIAATKKSMAEEGRAAQLRGFEMVAEIALIPEPFTVENNLLTPTCKLKRADARKKYDPVLEQMYARLPTGEPPIANTGGGTPM